VRGHGKHPPQWTEILLMCEQWHQMPEDVEDNLSIVWRDRWAALQQARKQLDKKGGSDTTTAGGVTRRRVV
jgi:hypothetical protein